MGAGSSLSGTAGAWAGADLISATGAVSVIGTLSATWQVTGVQLEKGSTATSFDYRPYGTEFMLCQRYFELFNIRLRSGLDGVTGTQRGTGYFKVTKRATPTITGTVYSTITETTTDGFNISRENNPTDSDSPLGISAEL